MKRTILMLAVVGITLGGPLGRTAGVAPGQADLRSRLVGTWRLMAMKVNGHANTLPQSAVTYKHVTPQGFMWLSYEKGTGKVFRAAGGTYTLRGNTYTEHIEYGLGDDYQVIRNSSSTFTVEVTGTRWHHTGRLANGTTLDEVWERLPPAR